MAVMDLLADPVTVARAVSLDVEVPVSGVRRIGTGPQDGREPTACSGSQRCENSHFPPTGRRGGSGTAAAEAHPAVQTTKVMRRALINLMGLAAISNLVQTGIPLHPSRFPRCGWIARFIISRR